MDQETFWEFVLPAFDGRVGELVLLLLAFMLAGTLFITAERIYRYREAHRASLEFRRLVGASLRDHNPDELTSLARTTNSPTAIVIEAGLAAHQSRRAINSNRFVFETVKRAFRLSARVVHSKLSRGLNDLTAIAATAILVGAFGTCYDMLTGFKGCDGSLESCQAAVIHLYSQSVIPTALGLVVALTATWSQRYLASKMSYFDLEMDSAFLELANYLVFRETLAGSCRH